MGELITTRASAADVSKIISLAKKIWLPAFSPYFQPQELTRLFEGMYQREKLLDLLDDVLYEFYFVLNSQRKETGYFAIKWNENYLKLDKIYVLPELKRKGIGGKIYAHIKQKALQNGYQEIKLNVNRQNLPAIEFYKKHKFIIEKEVDLPAPHGFVYRDYIMKCRLE